MCFRLHFNQLLIFKQVFTIHYNTIVIWESHPYKVQFMDGPIFIDAHIDRHAHRLTGRQTERHKDRFPTFRRLMSEQTTVSCNDVLLSLSYLRNVSHRHDFAPLRTRHFMHFPFPSEAYNWIRIHMNATSVFQKPTEYSHGLKISHVSLTLARQTNTASQLTRWYCRKCTITTGGVMKPSDDSGFEKSVHWM